MYPNSFSGKSLKRIHVLILAMGLSMLQACGDGGATDLKRFVDTAYQDTKPEIDPLPIIEPFKAFEYASSELSDPYAASNIVSARDAESRVAEQRDVNRRREALEEFPLDALAMVGTLSQNGAPWVIVQTAVGTAHLATIGNFLGQNEGRIKEIFPEEQRIVIEESVLDPAGRLIAREVEMTIDEIE